MKTRAAERGRTGPAEKDADLREIADALPAMVWTASAQGGIHYLNRRWLDFCGASAPPAAEWPDLALHPADREGVEARWRQALEDGVECLLEARHRRHDGEYRWLLTHASPQRSGNRIVRWIGIAVDVHEQKDMAERARDADRRKDEFLATLAHELRNPLAAILSSVQLVQLGKLPESELKLGHDVIARQTRVLTRLVEDLLDVSRIGRGQVQLRKEDIELNGVLRSAAEASRPQLEQSQHELLLVLPPKPVRLHADPVRVIQIVCNLLTNAAMYTPAKGRIELLAGVEGDQVVIQVNDTGIGIPQELLPRIFEPFTQGGSARSPTGLGIGLALARQLVQLHGGTIDVRSGGVGTGTGFTVRLPRTTEHAAAAAAPLPEKRSPHARRVLIVDDNKDATRILSLLLSTMGHEVCTVYDGMQALAAAVEFKPNVVLLDIGLPGMDGHEVARRLRAAPGGEDLLLIAVTGWGHEEARRRSKDAGFDHHVVKPVDSKTLRWLMAGPER